MLLLTKPDLGLYQLSLTPMLPGKEKEGVKVALRPSNAKRLYTEEKSTETGEIKE